MHENSEQCSHAHIQENKKELSIKCVPYFWGNAWDKVYMTTILVKRMKKFLPLSEIHCHWRHQPFKTSAFLLQST